VFSAVSDRHGKHIGAGRIIEPTGGAAVNRRCLIISCEHGGHEVPAAYAALFTGHEVLLDSHRGWDPGALQLGRQMADTFGAPLYASTTTRLLVDLNRSIGHRQLHSEATRGLTRAERQAIVIGHYRPHRDAIEGEIACRIVRGEQVIHIASHSFTPELNGVVRRADVAWLYDPRRVAESALVQRWLAEFAQRSPGLRLRRNYPYQGRGDGLASVLRKRYPDPAYVGIELEVNQRFAVQGGAPWQTLRSGLVESLAAALATQP
jgi:predicted N-formylglutamate amidohydrolase